MAIPPSHTSGVCAPPPVEIDDKEHIPLRWAYGVVVAIFKKKDPTLQNNYRPITLLDTMYKIYTRLIANRLSSAEAPFTFFTENGIRIQ